MSGRIDTLVDPRFPRLVTRRAAEVLVREYPKAFGNIVIDCTYVESMSDEYRNEILKHWPDAKLVGANEIVEGAWPN